jgi:hypothetical protein
MPVTQKKWQKAMETVEQRARTYMQRHGGNYGEAVAAVLKRNPKLAKAYQRSSPKEPLAPLRDLADYLNAEAQHGPGEASALYEILVPLKHMDASDAERETARARLEQQFSRVTIRCVPLLAGGMLRLGLHYPAGYPGILIRALHEGMFTALHCCRWCRKFFVDEDHRATYCSEACSNARASHRVKVWRYKRRGKELPDSK